MKIIQLHAENIKRLKAVDITPTADVVVISGKNENGKQQPISEPVLTPRGWQSIGTLKIGDFVIGSDGAPTKVMGIYPQKERTTFLVTMSDGGSTRCGPDHLWTVIYWKNDKLVTDTLPLHTLIEHGLRRGSHRCWSIPLIQPVVFADLGMEMPINPYTLGVILGDGHIEPTGYVTVTSYDEEILNNINVPGWRSEHELGTAFWSRPLRHLGLAGLKSFEKFIPPIYFQASVEDRKALLAGLLDTDGTAPPCWAEFTTTSKQLADDVVTLGSSLGYHCKIGNGLTKKYRYKDELKQGRMAWNIKIKSPESPFCLARKNAKWSIAKYRPEPRRFIESVIEVDPEDSVCIKVEADDGLYITKDYILTHNTSVIDSIWLALEYRVASKKNPEPLRKGESKAIITLDLGDYIVTRRFTESDTSLEVRTPDGSKITSPQKLLDGMIGDLSFDPLEFSQKTEQEQRVMLGDLLYKITGGKLNLADFEARKQEAYDARTEANRERKRLVSLLANLRPPTDADPSEELSSSDLTTSITDAISVNQRIKDLNAFMDRAKQTIIAALLEIERQKKLVTEAETIIVNGTTELEKLEPQDVTFLQGQLKSIEESNRRAREVIEYQNLKTALDTLDKDITKLNEKMELIEIEKAEALEAAPLPVKGFTVNAEGVRVINEDGQDVPYCQASGAQRFKISLALAMAANPTLRVIRIQDGSLLDDDSMAVIQEMAKDQDFQVWIEFASRNDQDRIGIFIEDGMVK